MYQLSRFARRRKQRQPANKGSDYFRPFGSKVIYGYSLQEVEEKGKRAQARRGQKVFKAAPNDPRSASPGARHTKSKKIPKRGNIFPLTSVLFHKEEKEDATMKRKNTATRILLSALLTALLLTGCGGSGGGMKSNTASPPSAAEDSGGTGWGESYDFAESESLTADAEAPEPSAAPNVSGQAKEGGELQPEKIIRTAQLTLETTDFEKAAASLEQLAAELGGYVESGSVGDRGSGYSWGDYTIRVPSERFDTFLSRAGELCHETWRNVERQNISERYYDTAGRLKTQQIKLERLQQLLSEAEEMADIITIESAISETEWMIEDLSGTLRHYDAQVDFSTIQVSLQEVYRLSNVVEAPESFAGRLGSAFTDGLRSFGESMENLAVGLAYSWMWWLLLIVVVILVVRLVRGKLRLPSLRRKKHQTAVRNSNQDASGEKRDDKSEDV